MIRPKDRRSMDQNSVSGEALLVLRCVRENARLGQSNKLSDVKATLEASMSLEFDTYFFFLRKHHYLALDHRDGQLKLTDDGDKVVDGQGFQKFVDEASAFFAEQLHGASGQNDKTLSGASLASLGQPPVGAGAATEPPRSPEFKLPSFRPPEEHAVRPPSSSPPSSSPLRKRSLLERTVPPEEAPEPQPLGVPPGGDPRGHKGTDVDLRYVKFDAIGSGPLGTVFKGRHNALGTDICVKELKDIFGYFSFLQRGEVVKRLKKELCAQAQVRHPCIVSVLDQNTDVARPYYVMELLQTSLRQRLIEAAGQPMPVKTALRWFLQAVYALQAAHHAGLYHHNLKPENFLLDASGNVKLSDFGLSRVIEVDTSKGMPQVFMGTGGMAYLSPEQLSRSREPVGSADVYAMGILLYEMLTGTVPGRRSPMPSEVNSEVPKGLDALFDKMTQDKPDSRARDMEAVLDAFFDAVSGKGFGEKGDLLLWSTVSEGTSSGTP